MSNGNDPKKIKSSPLQNLCIEKGGTWKKGKCIMPKSPIREYQNKYNK